MLRHRLRPPIPRDRRRGRLARRPDARPRPTATGSPRSSRRPTSHARDGVVIFPDVRGPLPLLRGARASLRRARASPRSRSTTSAARPAPAKRDDEFEYMPHVDQTTDDGVQADARAAVEQLRGAGVGTVFSVGFCFGGRASWVAAASGHGLAGSVGLLRLPDAAARRPERRRARRRDRVPDPGAAGRRRRRASPPTTTPRSSRR